jgi:hypothetical protein
VLVLDGQDENEDEDELEYDYGILDPSASARLRMILDVGRYRSATLPKERAVRELRQRRAYYRCCIPALAGFVSRRSIVPDGYFPMDQLEEKGNGFLAARPSVARCAADARQHQGRVPGFVVGEEFGAWSFGLSVLGFGFSVAGRLKDGVCSSALAKFET